MLVDKLRHAGGRLPYNVAGGQQLGSFLRGYGALIAPAAAIINGFIAVLVAQFFTDHPIAKTLLVVAAGLLGAAAVLATFYSQRQIVANTAKERTRIIETRETLGSFIADGDQLLLRFLDPNDAIVGADANQWLERVGIFLINELGQSYLARFQNSSGAPTVVPGGAITDERRNYWVYINQRLARIEQFSEELHPAMLVK